MLPLVALMSGVLLEALGLMECSQNLEALGLMKHCVMVVLNGKVEIEVSSRVTSQMILVKNGLIRE